MILLMLILIRFSSTILSFLLVTLYRVITEAVFPATLGPMLTVAESLYASGYDVHIFVPKESPSILSRVIGPGVAYNEIQSAIIDRSVTQIALIGYSHGGGAIYNLAKYMKRTELLQSRSDVTMPFSCYIDAIEYRVLTNLTGEQKPLHKRCIY